MGLIRNGLVVVLSIVLFLTLLFSGLFLTLNWSLEYENVKTGLGDFAQEYIDSFEVNNLILEKIPNMESTCDLYTSYTFTEKNFTFEIPCEVVDQGSENIISFGMNSLIEQIYYKNYTCEFWNCIKTQDVPVVLVSETAKDYWKGLFNWALLATIGIFILMFIVAHSKNSPFIIGGVFLILISLVFRKIDWLIGILPESIEKMAMIFVSSSHSVFVLMIITGLVLLFLGIAFHFLKLGKHISNLLRKIFPGSGKKDEVTKDDIKEIVDKEIKENNKKSSKENSKKDSKGKKNKTI